MRIPDSVSQVILQYLQAQSANMPLEGEVFTGRIISVDGDFLLMQLFDGREITAQVKADVTYNPGDILKLKVIDRQQGKLIVQETERSPAQNDSGIENIKDPAAAGNPKTAVNSGVMRNPADILKSMNLPVNKLHSDIVSAILDMGKEPEKELFQKVLDIMKESHIEEPRPAVFMVLNGMEDGERFHELVTALDKEQFRFTEELSNLLSLMDSSGDDILSGLAERIRTVFSDSLIMPEPVDEKQAQSRETVPDNEHPAAGERPASEGGQQKNLLIQKPVKRAEIALPKADQWLSDLKKELSGLRKFVTNSTLSNREEILSRVDRLDTAIRFFTDLKGFVLFVQIPFIYRDNQKNGELYIMRRTGRKGKIDSRDFTFFLSLSTDNIGDLDIFVHVRNKNVMVKVFAGDENHKPLFTDEYRSLYEALKEKGYTLFDLGFELKDDNINVFNAERKALLQLDKGKTKIDIRV